jgi:hypothetical protein
VEALLEALLMRPRAAGPPVIKRVPLFRIASQVCQV